MRVRRWLNRTLVLPLLAVLLLLSLLLFTQPGLRFSVWIADSLVDELSIGKTEGAWLSGVSLADIRFKNAIADVQLESLTFRLQKRCIIQLRVCIPELKLRGSRIDLASLEETNPDTVSAAPAEASGSGRILLPIPININRIILEDVALNTPTQQLAWQSFSTTLVAWGSRVRLSETRWHQLSVELAPAATETAALPGYHAPVLPEFSLPLSILIEDFQLTEFSFKQAALHQQLAKLTLSAQLTPQQIRLLDVSAEHPLASVQFSANVELKPNYPLQAQLDATLNQGDFAGQRLKLTLGGDLADLSLSLLASGPITAELHSELALLTDDLPLQLSLQSPQLNWPLSAPTMQLQDTQLKVTGRLSALNLSLASAITGSNLPDSQLLLQGQWQHWQQQLDLAQLQLTTLGGMISAEGLLNLQQQIAWQLALTLNDIQPGQYWPDFPGRLQGSLQTQGSYNTAGQLELHVPQVNLSGPLRGQALQIQGELALTGQPANADWQLTTPGLTLSHGSNTLSVQGSLAEQWQLDGEITLPQLAMSIPGLKGAINGALSVRGLAKQPDISIALNASKLNYEDFRLAEANLTAQVSLAQPIRSQLKLSATKGQYQQQRLQQLSLELSGTELAHQLKLALTADEFSTDINLSGALTDRQLWQAELQQVALTSPAGAWQLTAPLPITVDIIKQQLSLAAHCWQQAPTTLCLTEATTLNREAINLSLTLADYQLAQLNPLLPYQSSLKGGISLQLAANWQQGQAAKATLQLNGEPGSFTQQLDVPVTLDWSALSLTASLEQHQLRSQLELRIGKDGLLQAQTLISDLNQEQKPLRSEITLQNLTLDFLRPLLDEYSELAGTLSSQLSISGDLAEPQIAGELRLADLRVKGKLAPTDIEQADLQVKFTGEQASLSGIVNTPEGRVTLSGDANWQQREDWRLAVQVKGDELKLQIPQALLFVKPDLQITAAPGRSKITGIVQIPRATIIVDSLPQNAVGLSNDLVLLDRRLKPISEEQAAAFAIETDIRVQLGQAVSLSAFGLKTRLNGDLRVQQQQFNPTVRGEVNLQDGTFRAYGQDLLIRQGKMTFSGPADQPFLNVEAIRNPINMEDDVIAGIRVTGPADQPVISIFSEPSKPQANALSYLIMGRDLDSESGNAANSVTTSLIGMSFASSGKLVGEIGEAFGVSDLTLDTEGAGDNSQVTVSGYLTRDLQLKYGIGIFQPIGQFTLRYRLMRSLFLEAVSGLDNAVDVLYKFEFD
ncbi:MAG: translocation/assembly module TamB [Alishewanella sp.]|nr:translocation/assembly module TamB [Alishewanella sp.]